MSLSQHERDKYKMWLSYGGHIAKCDHCQRQLKYTGIEKHEIFHRSASKKGTESYSLLMHPDMCALLCPQCHWQWHAGYKGTTPQEMRDKIFQRKYVVTGRGNAQCGYSQILRTFKELCDSLTYTIGYELPEPH